MQHKATWAQNSVVFSMPNNTNTGITWSFATEPFLIDFEMQEAALAQLQIAYGLSVDFPDSERQILTLMGMSEFDIESGKSLYFSWDPPLPEIRASQAADTEGDTNLAFALSTIAELFKDGLLSQEEFRLAKSKLLR